MGGTTAATGVDSIRLNSERAAQAALLADPAVKAASDAVRGKLAADVQRRRLLAEALRVTDRLMPDFTALVKRAQTFAGLGERPIELYVRDDSSQNASCMDAGDGRVYLLFTSRLIERMTPGELLFIVGHELGHAAFDHHALPAAALLRQDKAVNEKQALALMSWNRRAELSCDRVGLMCNRSLQDAATALIKISCGLGEPHVRFNLEDFKGQMKDILGLSAKVEDVDDWYSSHPFTPMRVAALHEFAAGPGTAEAEARVEALLAAMEPQSPEAADASAAEVLLWSGLWVAYCENGLGDEERAALASLAPAPALKAALESLMAVPDQAGAARERALTAAQKARKLSVPDRHALVQKLIVIARADRRLDPAEIAALKELSSALGLAPVFVDKILSFFE